MVCVMHDVIYCKNHLPGGVAKGKRQKGFPIPLSWRGIVDIL